MRLLLHHNLTGESATNRDSHLHYYHHHIYHKKNLCITFQGRTRKISGSNPNGNNVWPMRMSLRTSRISRPSLIGRKPVQKPKKIVYHIHI